jgi:hypothetical protein
MTVTTELHPEERRSEYYQLLNRELPLRAKGVPYGRISGPLALLMLFAGLFVVPFFALFFKLSEYKIFVVLAIMVVFLLLLPREYYSDAKRSVRYVKKNFPFIYKRFQKITQRDMGEVMTPSMPILKIEGEAYFMGYYVLHQKQGNTLSARITGYALSNGQGQWVEDEELFAKAFLTYDFSLLGSITSQNISATEQRELKEVINIYTPRSEKLLIRQRKVFEKSNLLSNWQEVINRLPALYVAGREALTVFDALEKYRRSIGYSFGREYLYEDAMEALKMRQAFSKYMVAAHHQTIDAVRIYSARSCEELMGVNQFIGKQTIMKSMKQIWSFGVVLSNLIQRMAENGIPSEDDLKAFREKTSYAKQYFSG